MDRINSRLTRLGKGNIAKAAFIFLAAAAVFAAAVFLANNQPFGYIAPPALNTGNFSKGRAIAYTPWFETGSFRGDLIALPVGSSGVVVLLAPDWRASDQLDIQNYDTGRRIVTTDGAGTGVPFRFDSLTPFQQAQVGDEALVDFVRGDRSNEGTGGVRQRISVLGAIIHSGPVYVGKPNGGYIFDDYLSFANSNAGRQPLVFVGANDGMLHAFNTTDGSEAYAYVPSMVMGNLPKLADDPYNHTYYVDGFLTVEDAQFSGWRTVLVGGLGAGGKGYYALDVTSAAAGTEAAVASKILWEFHSGVAGAANLGYSYSRPSIVRLDNGNWVAVVGNGYLSSSGAASLYLLDIGTGLVVREIVVPDLDGNGLSSPTIIDADFDGYADTAYAGDLNGNLWKFDLNAGTVAFGGQPLFRTALNGGVRQPITTAPEVGHHPEGGVMVYIGTGQLFSADDVRDKSTQAVYGIWDNDAGTVDIADLRTQQLRFNSHSSGVSVRTASANQPDWETHRGWATPIEIVDAGALDKGERVIQDLLLRDGRIAFMAVNPTLPSGENWMLQLDALSGGGPEKVVIDVDGNNTLDVGDNVDGNGDGAITDSREDRVIGQYQNFGLASRPITGVIGGSKDAALVNHLTAISPAWPFVANPDDPGLLGGHFDLDTSHLIYPFSGGDTDGHVHEWDDKHDATTINFFVLPDGRGNPLYEIDGKGNPENAEFAVESGELFLLTVANTELSPGGVLEINSTSINVQDYHDLMNRYLTGTLLAGESFPIYTLDKPTPTQAAAGVERLRGLKLSFDAFAIISGDIIPSETGCVRRNDMGAEGEYRNGALMIQALDASDIAAGFVLDDATDRYVSGSTAIHATHGHATEGLHWEMSIFWHWKEGCYHEPEWAPAYEACIINGLGGCTENTSAEEEQAGKKKKKKKKKKKGEDPVPPGFPVPPPVAESDHSVTNTTVGGANDLGRLFWKELIPEE